MQNSEQCHYCMLANNIFNGVFYKIISAKNALCKNSWRGKARRLMKYYQNKISPKHQYNYLHTDVHTYNNATMHNQQRKGCQKYHIRRHTQLFEATNISDINALVSGQ